MRGVKREIIQCRVQSWALALGVIIAYTVVLMEEAWLKDLQGDAYRIPSHGI